MQRSGAGIGGPIEGSADASRIACMAGICTAAKLAKLAFGVPAVFGVAFVPEGERL